MHIIGDVHGEWQRYFHLVKSLKGPSVQIGDHGHGHPQGWKNDAAYCAESLLKRGHRFFQGNHDWPEECRRQVNFLGSVGYRAPVFWIGGGLSIDANIRRPGISWWPDEQLTEAQRDVALELYKHVKPRYVLSHDAPTLAARALLKPLMEREAELRGIYESNGYVAAKLKGVDMSVISTTMQKMLDAHQPDLWYFAHFHTSKVFTLPEYDTLFTCVGIMEVVQAPFEFETKDYISIAPDGTPVTNMRAQ